MLSAFELFVATASFASSSVIDDRQKLMKANDASMKEAVPMLKGEAPFDLTKVQVALKTYVDGMATFLTLFPVDSQTGGDTSASPKIWSDAAGFATVNEKFAGAIKAASDGIKDEASFKSAFPDLLKNCGPCHDACWVKKN